MAEVYREKVANLHEALNDPATRVEAADILRTLIDEIALMPAGKETRIEIKGDLAGMLPMARKSKSAAPKHRDGAVDRQLKLVAGKCNHLKLLFEAAA